MLAGLAILFWLSVGILLIGLCILANDPNENGGQILFFVGLCGMLMFGMSYLVRADVEERKESTKKCDESCGGQYIHRDDECFCVKGYIVKPEKENN